ncbi:ankyrin repeat domain-containing protein [Vagococcus sp.]|uniref:ankyrin repeat domain-containing protein n=1 Tax=Vagococcus sp. TaxID=1933889 RepID=UPI002FC7DC19
MKQTVLLLSLIVTLTACDFENRQVINSREGKTEQTTTKPKKKEVEEIMSFEMGSLLQAVEEGKEKEVKEILKDKEYDLNEVNEKKESSLLIATHNNQVEIAKVLIDHGADINLQDEIQDSPYLYAGAQGKTEILAYMLKHATPNQTSVNRFGGNALIPAAEKGHLANVKLLLEDGRVDIDHQNNYGYTALIEAVALRDGSKVYQDIVAELLNYNADVTLKDNNGKTATDYARALGYNNMLNQLENKK